MWQPISLCHPTTPSEHELWAIEGLDIHRETARPRLRPPGAPVWWRAGGRGTHSQAPSLPGPPLVQGTPPSLSERYLCKTDTGTPFPGVTAHARHWTGQAGGGWIACLAVPCASTGRANNLDIPSDFPDSFCPGLPTPSLCRAVVPTTAAPGGQGPAPPRRWLLSPPPPRPAQVWPKPVSFADLNPSPSKS